MTTHNELVALSVGELDRVTGGAERQQRPQPQPQPFHPFGFLAGPYKGIVFGIAAEKGGTALADKLYGRDATAQDRAIAQDAMREFLQGGGKLPKGAPDLFGSG